MTTDPQAQQEAVSTGLEGLDRVLDGLRIGDNVVWRVDDIEDYRRFVEPFVAAARAQHRSIIYLRFGSHPPLVEPGPGIEVVEIDALGGFEPFTRHVFRLVTEYGRGAFYLCDCLSDLLEAWATDHMVGNFFRAICPYLYEMDTVAWFALYPHSHSHTTLSRIRDTTQVMIDVRRAGGTVHVQPVKVWRRSSPTMFLPHRQRGTQFEPVVDSSEATRLQALLEQPGQQHGRQLLDYWDRLFLAASDALAEGTPAARRARVQDDILRVLLGRDERMLELARRHLGLEQLLAIRSHMVGSGYIGGKAAGMLLARRILLARDPQRWGQALEPHDSYFVGTDVYYAYLVHNGWWPRLMRQRTAEGYFDEARGLRDDMLHGEIPPEVRRELERVLDHYGQYPILVRSSSLLEDGFGNAFAGKYESVFCVNQGSPGERLAQLEDAIRRVYASTLSEDALSYRHQRGLVDQEEPMALLLQRVNGRYHGSRYLPDAAGVGVSRNTFVWDATLDPAAGMLRLVLGLGIRAVDRVARDHACVVALDHPERRPFHSRDETYRYSQHAADVLDIEGNRESAVPIQALAEAAPDLPLHLLGEIDREASRRAREQGREERLWRVTFNPLLQRTGFAPLMRDLLRTLEAAYAHPVDVEFTVHLDADGNAGVNLVQCRPLATLGSDRPVELPARVDPQRLLFASQGRFMGGNLDLAIDRVIRVDGARYAVLPRTQKFAVARLVGALNRQYARSEDCATLLIGPGRWGTSTPELGVPVRFADIDRVCMLVEVADPDAGIVPDLSFGSHFFQDLVEARIAYAALFSAEPGCEYHPAWLDACPAHTPEVDPEVDLGEPVDPAVRATVQVHDTRDARLRVVADVVQQRLLGYQPGNARGTRSRGDSCGTGD